MSESSTGKDLVCLVADKNMEQTLLGLLRRPEALGIRAPSFDLFVHEERDPGCCRHGAEFLRPFTSRYRHALLIFDHEGCGQEGVSPRDLERRLESELRRNGWDDRARVVAIEPELEAWVWSDSPEVDAILGWSGRLPDLRSWLAQKGLLPEDATKPPKPKEAVEAALYEVRKPRSSATYRQLAETVSFRRCQDRKFARLKSTLRRWFGT